MSTVSTADEFPDLQDQVELIIEAEGEFSPNLFEPLIALADEQRRQGYIDDARESLAYAQNIAHRNEGVNTPSQFEVLDRMTDLDMLDDDAKAANNRQKFRHFVAKRHFEDIGALPSHFTLVDWYLKTGQYVRARGVLDDAIELIEEDGGENDPRAIRAHLLIAKARRLEGICCSDKAVRKAIAIMDANDSNDNDLRRELYAEMGDSLTVHRQVDRAAEFYREAASYGFTSETPSLLSMSRELNAAEGAHKRVYKVEDDILRGTQFEPLTNEEALSGPNQAPQKFVVPGEFEPAFGIIIRDAHSRSHIDEFSHEVIGQPYQFYWEQVKTIVPIRLEDFAAMAGLRITLTFSVREDGLARNIEVLDSNAPVKLDRLLREAVRKSRFRPALVDGQPTTAHNVTLTQTFLRKTES